MMHVLPWLISALRSLLAMRADHRTHRTHRTHRAMGRREKAA